MKKIIKYFIGILFIYFSLCFATPFNTYLRNRSIDHQINYLSRILDKGYDNELQSKFPEGKVFSNALLALSVIYFSEKKNCNNEKYNAIVDKCIIRLQSIEARRKFSSQMTPKYGMFYNGWVNYVLTAYQKSKLFANSKIQNEVLDSSSVILERFERAQNNEPYLLDSYIGSYWPADNMIGIVTLKDAELRKNWLDTLFNSARHDSGLIHHAASNSNEIRGSSSAMITYCLCEMDYENLSYYNNQYKNIFVDSYLGLELVKENEDGSNHMDIDSGPVVWGYGASATIMNIKTQACLNNTNAKITWAAMNIISLPINVLNNKYYLLNKEPMFDLFMLWASVEI